MDPVIARRPGTGRTRTVAVPPRPSAVDRQVVQVVEEVVE